MKNLIKSAYKRVIPQLKNGEALNKNEAELKFWRKTILDLISWYNGEKELYGTPCPDAIEKIKGNPIAHNAILTWHKIHQESKYLADLDLRQNVFAGMKLLDIGAGPIPSATVFEGATLYSLDHLMGNYLEIGYPVHYYNHSFFVHAKSEALPFEDNFIDAVISVNAIDHVDDFWATSKEIQRVLRPDGLFRMHVHYHTKTVCEPIELNDEVFESAYQWLSGLYKVSESDTKFGSRAKEGEKYAVWSNF